MSTTGRHFVYILASRKYGVLYTGFTGDLPVRVYIHREALIPGFSSRYRTYRLVYFEQHDGAYEAITREKQIKKWRRAWKIELIEKQNPGWTDLYDSLF
ncbi:GIY-YIG nuclease family protein [Devosia sp.]|uniref:GIY-YIG nuclease family protein n=1 Tax=Devosia sp. TaxID=1871048 RepID=UPI0035B48DCE